MNDLTEPDRARVKLTGSVAFSIKLLAVLGGCAALYMAKAFFMPIVFAMVLALTLSPLIQIGERIKLPPALVATLLMLSIATVIALGISTLATPLSDLMEDGPKVGNQLREKLKDLTEPMQSINEIGEEAGKLDEGASGAQEVVIKQPGLIARAADDFATIVANILLTLVLTFFLIVSRDMILTKVIRVLPRLSDRKKALAIAHDVESDVSHYLLMVALINTTLGVAVGLWCWSMGMPNPLLFGVLAGTLNFLPYVGSAVGILITAAVAIISFPTLGGALLVPLGYLVFTAVEGQFVTPTVLGRRFSLNIVIILVSIAFWGFIWGAVGVFLAVPILIIFKAFCDRVEQLDKFAEFLAGDNTPSKVHHEAENGDADTPAPQP